MSSHLDRESRQGLTPILGDLLPVLASRVALALACVRSGVTRKAARGAPAACRCRRRVCRAGRLARHEPLLMSWAYDQQEQWLSTTSLELKMLPLEEQISPALKATGFAKRARTWWRQSEETIQVFNLQKSASGAGLLFNLGIYVRALGTESRPPVGRCHIQARLEGVTDQPESMLVLSAWSDPSPTAALASVVLRDGVAWLDKFSTIAGMRQHVPPAPAARMLVVDAVRDLLSESAG